MAAAETTAEREQGPRVMPFRVVLFLLTVLSAAAALFLEPALAGAVSRRAISGRWLFLPIAIYVVFLLVYAGDRLWLVKHRRYPAGRAFFQIAFGLVFASLLLPETIQDFKAARPAKTGRLLAHPDPEVREVAVMALGFEGPTPERAGLLLQRLEDDNRRVRQAALRVLASWSGRPRGEVGTLRAWARGLSSGTSTTTQADVGAQDEDGP